MELTQTVDWVNKSFIGYVMNAEFSDDNAGVLMQFMKKLKGEFNDAVYCPPRLALHITLLDWIATLVDYDGQDKDTLYTRVQHSYDTAMSEILASVKPITVHFDTIIVKPNTIIITGTDDGSFQKIRDQFIDTVELLPNTKMPPEFIHSSLARFTQAIELDAVNAFIANQQIDFTQEITNFRLIRTTKEPNLEFETLKRYELK